MKYQVNCYAGGPDTVAERQCATKREARSWAWHLAKKHGIARPVWVDGSRSWNCDAAIGGYDAGGAQAPGAYCAVVERVEVQS